MELIKKVYSKVDSTVKYVFRYIDEFNIEFSFIDKNDGKYIICVPCQTMCAMNCKFCHTRRPFIFVYMQYLRIKDKIPKKLVTNPRIPRLIY